jgi:hypothetical protein
VRLLGSFGISASRCAQARCDRCVALLGVCSATKR